MERPWILTIGIDKFRLTPDEHDKYLEAVNKGARYVVIQGNVLSTQFQTLVRKESLEGKWQCDYGKWHALTADCLCNSEFRQLPNGSISVTDKPNTDVSTLLR